jgi:hypothetical protein
VDERQASTVPGVFLAGEVCGVGGASMHRGRSADGQPRHGSAHGRLADRLRRRRAPVPCGRHAPAHRCHGWLTWLGRPRSSAGWRRTARDHRRCRLPRRHRRTDGRCSAAGMGWCRGGCAPMPLAA